MSKPLFLYLISHNRKDIKTHTYIGCVEDFVSRLHQHNGQKNGGPRITRRAAGSWDPVIVLKLPKTRKFNSKSIKREWKQSSRGLESRIRKGLALAMKYNLTCYIMKDNKRKIPILEFLESKWDNDRIQLTDGEWNKILDG
jgi:hypothetical protein